MLFATSPTFSFPHKESKFYFVALLLGISHFQGATTDININSVAAFGLFMNICLEGSEPTNDTKHDPLFFHFCSLKFLLSSNTRKKYPVVQTPQFTPFYCFNNQKQIRLTNFTIARSSLHKTFSVTTAKLSHAKRRMKSPAHRKTHKNSTSSILIHHSHWAATQRAVYTILA